jgi:very-short-patch-repair endonuclease
MKTEEFITKAKHVHGDRYDYSKVNYINCKTKVVIICKKHGEFLQRPEVHLRGSGCNKCSGLYSPTTEEFIEKAKEKHGDTYDYSKVEYMNANTKVRIICREHGEFLQTPSHHIGRGDGCIKCGITYSPTTEEFIANAKEKHGDTYDYSKVEYINANTNIIIICRQHGEFLQTPHGHLRPSGCNNCGIENACNIRRKDIEQFIEEANQIHNNKYDYSRVDYINSITKVRIICREHGEFLQTPPSHLNGSGCSKCAGKYVYNNDEFIERAKEKHRDRYDYSKVDYKYAKERVIIICKNHGEFEQESYSHLNGSGCPKCANKYSPTNNEYIEKAREKHCDTYDYSRVDYKCCKERVIIICKTHGEFNQNAGSHLNGSGCPACINKTEGKLYVSMKSIYPSIVRDFRQDWCRKILCLPFDFCIQEHKIIIELDGLQHFKQVSNWSSPDKQFENDKFKEECANNNGYSVIRLLQDDVFYDTYDWTKELCEAVEEIKANDGITNIYLSRHDEYANY